MARGSGERRGFHRREVLAGGASLALTGCGSCDRGPEEARPAPELPLLEAARRHAGTRIRIGWESGLQARALERFAARFETLTGIGIDVVELGSPTSQFRRIRAEHLAGTGGLDAGSIAPAWVPELVDDGVLRPLDPWVERFPAEAALADLLPLYRDLGRCRERRWAIADDGDVLLLYHRRDLFEDDEIRRAFEARHGRPLPDPRRLGAEELVEVATFLGEIRPGLWGFAPFTKELRWGWFQALLRAGGGRFFDPETMRADVAGPAGEKAVATIAALEALTPTGPAGGAPETTIATFLSGNAALATFWPPLGRWAEAPVAAPGGPIPGSRVAGRVGYGLLPGGVTELAVAFALAVFARASNPDAAALFLLWLVSPEVSLARVMDPYGLRDPYRRSHVRSPEFRSLWPSAPAYLETLAAAASGPALLDLAVPGANAMEEAFHAAMVAVRLGATPAAALAELSSAWDAIVAARGERRVARAYREWRALPSSGEGGR